MPDRSLASDYPNLTILDIRLRSDLIRTLNGDLLERYKRWHGDKALSELDGSVKEQARPGCQISIIAHTRMASADLRVLVKAFPEDLRMVRPRGEERAIFRSEWRAKERCSVALEIEASESTRVVGP